MSGCAHDQAAQTDANVLTANAGTQPKPYPLKTCLVSGDVIGGEMGEPVTLVYKGQEIKFCCSDCVKDFKKDPDKYIKKLNEEVEKQNESK